MRWWCLLRPHGFRIALLITLLFVVHSQTSAQPTASIQGQIVDQHHAAVPGVKITARNPATGFERVATSDVAGRYQFSALPVGDYTLRVSAAGFKQQVLERLSVEVGRRITQDFQLDAGNISEQVTVSANNDIERSTSSVGHVIDGRMVQEIPLNGRYFLDLGLLVPGSVTPPQGAFSAAPMRGLGSLAINTAGNREETVNYQVNGITLNNLTFSSISFQPSINAIREFKADNSTFTAEYGPELRGGGQYRDSHRDQQFSWRTI